MKYDLFDAVKLLLYCYGGLECWSSYKNGDNADNIRLSSSLIKIQNISRDNIALM